MRHALLLTGLALLIAPSFAEAQYRGRNDADMRSRFGVKLMLGVGGEVEIDDLPFLGNLRVDDDMETTYGLAAVFDAPFHKYFTAGGWIAGLSWNHDLADDRNVDRFTMLDLDGFIKLRIPVVAGGMNLEPYVLLPLGLSVNFPSDDYDDLLNDRLNTGFGWNSGLLLGAVLFVSDNIGLNLEVGYTVHNVTHEVDDTSADFDLSIGQGAFNVGVLVALD